MASIGKINFLPLLNQLNKRTSRAVIGQLGFRNKELNNALSHEFSNYYGDSGSFLSSPVFEATFGWESSNKTLDDLAGNLLPDKLVDALNSPPKDLADEYRMPRSLSPYQHQYDAWNTLLDENWKSVIVASGTGSGKTECFLIPLLAELAREAEETDKPLIGVNTLMLYPLNALINSQRERLRAWTQPFRGKIRFALYNGETPYNLKSADTIKFPEEVKTRKHLWESPPPILVTNSTMLEYMLVRNDDRQILTSSQG